MPSSDSTRTSRIRGEGPDFEPMMNTMIIICAPTELLYTVHIPITQPIFLNILPNDFLSLSAVIFYFFFLLAVFPPCKFSQWANDVPATRLKGRKKNSSSNNEFYIFSFPLSLSLSLSCLKCYNSISIRPCQQSIH